MQTGAVDGAADGLGATTCVPARSELANGTLITNANGEGVGVGPFGVGVGVGVAAAGGAAGVGICVGVGVGVGVVNAAASPLRKLATTEIAPSLWTEKPLKSAHTGVGVGVAADFAEAGEPAP